MSKYFCSIFVLFLIDLQKYLTMKKYIFFLFLAFIACKNPIEENCFQNESDKIFEPYIVESPFSVNQILDEKPEYLEINNLRKFRSFKKDSIECHTYTYDEEKSKKKYEDYQAKYKDFNDVFFNHFEYTIRQKVNGVDYALGRNNLGFWLLEICNNQPKAFFLGLSFSHYYINKVQELPIIKDGFLQFEGSLVKIVKVAGLPGYDDYSAMEDGKLFKIKLADLKKDTDNDGYNDIFENCFGLNSNDADSDGDKINDFDDMNPLFKSEKTKFTSLYEELLPKYFAFDESNLKRMHYFFIPYESNCEYFQKINPKFRILILSNNSKKTDYLKVTDIVNGGFSKIKRDKKDANKFYISTFGSSSTTDFSAEYKKGKWIFVMVSQTNV